MPSGKKQKQARMVSYVGLHFLEPSPDEVCRSFEAGTCRVVYVRVRDFTPQLEKLLDEYENEADGAARELCDFLCAMRNNNARSVRARIKGAPVRWRDLEHSAEICAMMPF